MSVRPVVLGYLRTPDGATDDVLAWLQRELADYAEREGFCLAAVFVERTGAGSAALTAVMDALKRREAQAVLLPALEHLSPSPASRQALRHLIERETGAQVLIMYPSPRE